MRRDARTLGHHRDRLIGMLCSVESLALVVARVLYPTARFPAANVVESVKTTR
jgi:hypothetical protein